MKVEAIYHVDGIHIKDSQGRIVILRGCNLGGDSKIPFSPSGNPLTYDVSFTGRPFLEVEADEHFTRLAQWGFTFLRLVITWEALEHAGPGIYDEDYLAYLRNILKKAEQHGIWVFIDPHQDVWSRWTGGDGAPGWTLEAAGFDLNAITSSGSAFTQESLGLAYKPMSWNANYLYYAASTMCTLFFAGNTYAPSRMVDGVPIQDYLQNHFINAMKHTARRLKDCRAIVGFGTFNEPYYGFIGLADLNGHNAVKSPDCSVPTAFQAMAAASGYTQKITQYLFVGLIRKPGKDILNGKGVSLFRSGYECPWKETGVWVIENGKPELKIHDYFSGTVDFCENFLKPFQKKYMEALSVKHEHYLFFVEGIPMEKRPSWKAEDRLRADGSLFPIVEAMHWYDGLPLVFKKWRPWVIADAETNALTFGIAAVKNSIQKQLKRIADKPRSEGIPALLGEFGIPFDLDAGKSFKTGVYAQQEQALGSYYDAIDAELLSSTIWNYSVSNTHKKGDGWNTEDLSIYCADTGKGRAVKGFSRPYAMATAGIPVKMQFARKKRIFTFEWKEAEGKTEIFVPTHWYPDGWHSEFSGGNAILEEKPEEQRLFVDVNGGGAARIIIYPV